MSTNNGNSKRILSKQPYRPSFVTPPPSTKNLYGMSESSQGTSQETEVLSEGTEETQPLSTPPLSPAASPRAASAASSSAASNSVASSSVASTPASVPRLKKTAEPGYRGNPVFFNEHYKWWRRDVHKNGSYTNVPSNEFGTTVAVNDPRRNARRTVAPVESANWSSATPLSRRDVMARAAVSEGPDALAAPRATLFSPASRASTLSLTPKRKQPNNHVNSNSNGANHGKESRKGGARTRRKQRTQRHKKTRRS